METLGQLVARLRSERGLSMQQLGDAAGISHETISAIERGRRAELRSSTAIALFRAIASTGNLEADDAYKLLALLQLSPSLFERYGRGRMVALQNSGVPRSTLSLVEVLIDAAGGVDKADALLEAMIRMARVTMMDTAAEARQPGAPPHAPNAPPAPHTPHTPDVPLASDASQGAHVPKPAQGQPTALPPPPPGSVAIDAASGARVYEPIQRPVEGRESPSRPGAADHPPAASGKARPKPKKRGGGGRPG